MTSRRVLKAAEAIREVVGMAILTDLSDPRVEGVTVTGVEVSPDLRLAKVNVSVMGNDAAQSRCLHGLESAAGFLQSKLANRIDTRYTPKLKFVLDQGVKKSIAIAKALAEVLPEDEPATDDPPPEAPHADDAPPAETAEKDSDS
ncbi:Ribosome-binding factor A [Pseudobythopirellula maris]|uniref:Ribosome-binding factor A n=1 Tax=Pseudobythopirellula maris TaxID=2527991 RepID=A0A5C5ZGP5_9BACT|nr:30S ribosome-binding factor RbfA [Pseudobythopirellula maris]TWT86300.1 Ribosome-binding factor A [Pseudobythopirellula maris]